MANTRIYLGIGAFVAAAVGAIGAYQCFSVYSDEKNYESLHPYTALSPELVSLSQGAALGRVAVAVLGVIAGVYLIRSRLRRRARLTWSPAPLRLALPDPEGWGGPRSVGGRNEACSQPDDW
jgi:hypothetical protein